jgi:hypothetical protein
MEIICYRGDEISRTASKLPASCYNLAHTLLVRSVSASVFVPIRSMQYLAILDAEEFVFLDGVRKNWIEIAWQNFCPQQRSALDEPVSYEAVYYTPEAASIMTRLQREFALALQQIADRGRPQGEARVIKFDGQRTTPKG